MIEGTHLVNTLDACFPPLVIRPSWLVSLLPMMGYCLLPRNGSLCKSEYQALTAD